MSETEETGRDRLAAVVSEALGTSVEESKALSHPVATGPVEGAPHNMGFARGNRDEEQMAALDTCGQYGGWDQSNNHPCQRPSCFGILNATYGITQGKCFQHTDERMDALAQKKAAFLEAYMDQPKTLKEATAEAGIRVSMPYVWKVTDAGFRRTFEALRIIVDAVRDHCVEDAMYKRLEDVESGADTLRMFYLQNRSGGRWRDVRKDPAPQQPTQIINASGDVTVNNVKVWDMGNGEFVAFPSPR
jgi:hypothetical protein